MEAARPTHAEWLARNPRLRNVYRAGDLIEGEERRRGRRKGKRRKKRKKKKGGKKKSGRDACAAAVTAAATVAFVGQWNTVPVVAITSTAALAAVHQAASTRLATRASRSSSWLCGFREGFSTLPRGERSSRSRNSVRVTQRSSSNCRLVLILGIVSCIDQCFGPMWNDRDRSWESMHRTGFIHRIFSAFYLQIFIPCLFMYKWYMYGGF